MLTGHPAYKVTAGEVTFNGKNLLELSAEDRSHEGLFLSFQYPVEIPGVSMVNFMRAALNAKRKYLNLDPLSATDFLKLMREKRAIVQLDNKLASRSVNEGFSGGEKKRNEIFQMAVLEPRLSILDETDSGLDIDALRIVAEGVNKLKTDNNATIVITHYQRLLDYIKPDIVHVLYKGRIVKTAGRNWLSSSRSADMTGLKKKWTTQLKNNRKCRLSINISTCSTPTAKPSTATAQARSTPRGSLPSRLSPDNGCR